MISSKTEMNDVPRFDIYFYGCNHQLNNFVRDSRFHLGNGEVRYNDRGRGYYYRGISNRERIAIMEEFADDDKFSEHIISGIAEMFFSIKSQEEYIKKYESAKKHLYKSINQGDLNNILLDRFIVYVCLETMKNFTCLEDPRSYHYARTQSFMEFSFDYYDILLEAIKKLNKIKQSKRDFKLIAETIRVVMWETWKYNPADNVYRWQGTDD